MTNDDTRACLLEIEAYYRISLARRLTNSETVDLAALERLVEQQARAEFNRLVPPMPEVARYYW